MTSSTVYCDDQVKADMQAAGAQRPKIGLQQVPLLILTKAAEDAAKKGLATIQKAGDIWTVVFCPVMASLTATESTELFETETVEYLSEAA